MNLLSLKQLFKTNGCTRLYAKPLAENDNSKNQVYFGPDFKALNLFPNTGIFPDSSPKNPIFKAKLAFAWLLSTGGLATAPGAQLILYPQYPEVRFSGFLKGCANAPSELMNSRQRGRVLFMGTTNDGKIIGFVSSHDSPLTIELSSRYKIPDTGVFFALPLADGSRDENSRKTLLSELRRIHQLNWIDSKQLHSNGKIAPCNAPQCGGFTLEAELNIPKNSASEPDYFGWEIKQHATPNFEHPDSGAAITLMTPEPTGGYYKEQGPEAFVRKFGYADTRGRPDRLNFGGIHKIGQLHATTNLTLSLTGYDVDKEVITDANGAITLKDKEGAVAASWGFSGLFTHWARKHNKAAYVPSQCRQEPQRQYRYGHIVRLAEQTHSLLLLRAFAAGLVYYDPGIKLENATSSPQVKRRNQFRITSKNIHSLYQSVELVKL